MSAHELLAIWLVAKAIHFALEGAILWYLISFDHRDRTRKELIDALEDAYLKKHDPRLGE